MLCVHIRDVRRSTLPLRSGNEGWIGLSPKGDRYHVVVPVDAQIAKGVMACNWPTDGTPFGGYYGWLYFRCEPYDDEVTDEKGKHEECVRENCEKLLQFAASYGIICTIKAECGVDSPTAERSSDSLHTGLSEPRSLKPKHQADRHTDSINIATCRVCGRDWQELRDLLRDPTIRLVRYRVCPDNFQEGIYVFSHGCSGVVEVPVTCFGRTRRATRSLIASHACPGLCHYETSLDACSAACEGACYRRIAAKLKSRSTS